MKFLRNLFITYVYYKYYHISGLCSTRVYYEKFTSKFRFAFRKICGCFWYDKKSVPTPGVEPGPAG